MITAPAHPQPGGPVGTAHWDGAALAARLLAGAVIGLGTAVLLGWWLDVAMARTAFPGLASMKANAAASLLLAGLALIGLTLESPRLRRLARAGGALVAVIGAATLSQDLFGWDLGMDRWLIDYRQISGEVSGRMSPITALCLVLCGIALAAGSGRRGRRIALGGAGAAALLALLAFFGYLLDISTLYQPGGYGSMALHTATAFLLLAMGIVLARAQQVSMARVTPLAAGLAALVLLSVGAAVANRLSSLAMADRLESHTRIVLLDLEQLFSSLVDAEAAQRGYVATGGRHHLEIYRQAVAAAEMHLEELKRLTADNPGQQDRLAALEAPIGEQLAGMERSIRMREEGSPAAARESMLQLSDADMMPGIRQGIAALQAEELRLLESRTAGKERDMRRTVQTLAAGGVFGALILGTIFLLLWREVDLRRRGEAALHAAKEAAESANRAKSDFLATMSHEIRTPLNALLGAAQLLERESLDPDGRHLVRTIRTAGRSLLNIVNAVLDLAKIEAGHFEIERASFVLNDVMSGLVDVLRPLAAEKGLELELSPLPPGIGALVGDAQRLGQVLYNLTGNAIKFTAAGKVGVSVAMADRLPGRVVLRFAVRDTGIGIAADRLDSLFEAFVQAGDATGGTGLGLPISRRLVELMGGEMGVASEPGVGSEFWFDLPFASPTTPAAAAAAVNSSAGGRLAGLRVLVVDDSEINREMARRLLALEGASCAGADNGRGALERLQAAPQDFDMVLMDVQMPEMDGLEATRRIRGDARLSRLPVIALSAGALPGQRERAAAAGMDGFIAKPFELEAMVSAIQAHGGDRGGVFAAPEPGQGEEGFPEIPGIDRDSAISRFLGNGGLFAHALRLLCEEAPGLVAATRADLERGDRRQAEARMHRLRGQAANLSAEGLAERAARLEEALYEGIEDEFEMLLAQVESALSGLLAALPPNDSGPAAARPEPKAPQIP